MTFGTWLKKTFNKAKDFVVDKAIPAVKKAAGVVGKIAAPVADMIGGAIGGPMGNTIKYTGQKIGGFANKVNDKLPQGKFRPRLKVDDLD